MNLIGYGIENFHERKITDHTIFQEIENTQSLTLFANTIV